MEGYKEHSINERIADIARTLFGGNISLMARKTFIARNTINSIIKKAEHPRGRSVSTIRLIPITNMELSFLIGAKSIFVHDIRRIL
jgi:hypothetical protein